jgi:chemotaxis protein MotB
MAPGAMPRDAAGLVMGIPLAPTGEQSDSEAPDKTAPPENSPNPDPDAEELAAAMKEASKEDLQKALAEKEEKDFAKAEFDLKQAIQDIPELKPLQENLIIDRTPEGLRIQIVDQHKYSMFPVGSTAPQEHMRQLMALVARVVGKLPNQISVAGHTDSLPYPPGAQYTNWELSADRANASRRALIEGGLPGNRIKYVTGKAETEPLMTENPADPRNRRISVVLLRDAPATPGAAPSAAPAPATPGAAPVAPARPTATPPGTNTPANVPAIPSPSQARRPARG